MTHSDGSFQTLVIPPATTQDMGAFPNPRVLCCSQRGTSFQLREGAELDRGSEGTQKRLSNHDHIQGSSNHFSLIPMGARRTSNQIRNPIGKLRWEDEVATVLISNLVLFYSLCMDFWSSLQSMCSFTDNSAFIWLVFWLIPSLMAINTTRLQIAILLFGVSCMTLVYLHNKKQKLNIGEWSLPILCIHKGECTV